MLRELAEYAGEEKDKEFLVQITSPTPEGKVRIKIMHIHVFRELAEYAGEEKDKEFLV